MAKAMEQQKRGSDVFVFRELKPHLFMVIVQVGYTLLYFITEASFNHGMSPHVYVTYRHIVATLVMFPFAYFLERYICIHTSLVSYQILHFHSSSTSIYANN